MLSQAANNPPADAIRQRASEILTRPYYDLSESSSTDEGEPFLFKVIRAIAKPFRWLFDHMQGLPEFARWMIVIAVVLVCLYGLVKIIQYFVKGLRGATTSFGRVAENGRRETDPDELERHAETARAKGDYIGGVRLLFRAALRRIELFEKKKLRPGITNRELLRRYRTSPLAGPLARFVETIDLKWYGNVPCEQADYTACESEHDRIRNFADGRQFADAT